jgi:hypothetical protein
MAQHQNQSNREYDVAFSFAGEDRAYVEAVAASLRRAGVSVFYDRYEEAVLWGKNLYDHLRHVYAEAAEYTVMFVSEAYARKLWTNHERESPQSRAFEERREYILPALFDDTDVPGLLKTIGYADLRQKTPEELASLILKKLRPANNVSASIEPVSLRGPFFIQVGGTLKYPSPQYVDRIRDRQLDAAINGGFSAIIYGPRMVGKSSLLSKYASLLKGQNRRYVYADLASFGAKTPEQMLQAIAKEVLRDLKIDKHPYLTAVITF